MEKITGLVGSLAIVLAVVAGFVQIPGLNVALVILILGIVAGVGAPQDGAIRTMIAVIVLPAIGTTLGMVPAVGEYLGAIFNNVAVAAAGVGATLVARRLYELVMAGVKGLSSGG